MSTRRLAASFCAVVTLSFVAVVLQVVIWALPEHPSAGEVEEPEVQAPAVPAEAPTLEETRAARLLEPARAIVVDGAPITESLAAGIAGNAENFNGNIRYLRQYESLTSGCEIIALCVALQAEGFDAEPEEVATEHLRMGGDVSTDYVGEPWSDGGGYPPSIVDAANDWLADNGGGARAHDLTGSTFDGLLEIVARGYPVAVWTTEDMSEPRFVGDPDDESAWYFPEHCVVVYGTFDDKVLVSDSLQGLVRHDLREFTDIYKACGSRALFVAKM